MDIHGITARLKGALDRSDGNIDSAKGQSRSNTAPAEGSDTLSLSTISEILNKAPAEHPDWGTSFKTVPPIPHTVKELQASLDTYITAVRERISQIFNDAGIQLQEDVQLQADGENGFSVSAAAGQLDAVVNALGQDSQLGVQLGHLQQRHQLTGLLNAASVLDKGDNNNGDQFRNLRSQQTPLSLVLAANDSTAPAENINLAE